MIENNPESYLWIGPDGHIVYSNEAFYRLTGFTKADIVGQPLSRLYFHADDDVKADYELTIARKKGTVRFEGWKKRKDDSLFWADLCLTAVTGESGKCAGYICSIHDKSEDQRQKLELQASEERYRIMVSEVTDYAIFLLDTRGCVATWNEGARRIKGYLASEIIGKHFSTFYMLQDLENKKPAMELKVALETGKYEEEGWRVKKDGSLFWANVVITALFNANNEHIGFSKVTRDLTERRQHEESLRLNEERYRSLVEQVRDYGIFLLDDKGRIISWNEGARRINGYETEEILGKYFSIFYPEEDILSGKPARELATVRSEGRYEEEGWRLRKDGSRFWANIVITAVYDSNGMHTGFSKVTRDLTERKKFESEIRESAEKYRLLSLELQQRNDQLLAVNQELEQFTSVASHDLQEPLRSMASFLELVRLRLNEQRFHELPAYIEKAQKSAERMKNLIVNLLQYAQLSQADMATEAVDMNEVINDVLQNLKNAIEVKRAKISIESGVSHVQGDKVQMTQLMQNLVSNALKFTAENGPELCIRSDMSGNEAVFQISDNGIGIELDQRQRVFEIFRRVHSKNKYDGTGIGLAICKKIIERHHGHISIDSELGVGTTVIFSLPGISIITNGSN